MAKPTNVLAIHHFVSEFYHAQPTISSDSIAHHVDALV